MPEAPHRWWYCVDCFAINDGLEEARCWNCQTSFPSRRKKNKPWCEMGKAKCDVCGRNYVTWTLPAGTTMTVPDVLGFCPFYFEHHGDNAYFPPMLPSVYVLEANGYTYDEKRKKLVKNR